MTDYILLHSKQSLPSFPHRSGIFNIDAVTVESNGVAMEILIKSGALGDPREGTIQV
jgi:hypothetical protein